MATRKEQKEQRRQNIISAAMELFVTKGYGATKITDIAEKVNMSTGLLFHYFPSKEKLYEEIVRYGLLGTKYPLQQTYEHAIDVFEEFTGQLFEYMSVRKETAKLFVLMADAQSSEATPEHIRRIAMEVNTVQEFVPIVEWGQKEGSIRQGDPYVLSNLFWCCIQGIASDYAIHPERELPKAEWVVDLIRSK